MLSVGAFVVIAVVLWCWYWSQFNLTGDGGFILLEAKSSPGGSRVAEVFAYKGGATVRGFSILIVRPKDQQISPDDFSLRVANSEGVAKLKISWENEKQLWVQFPSAEHQLLMQESFGVAIGERRIE